MCIPFLFFWFTQNIIHHPENGGGVYILNGTINLNGGKITGNTAVEAGGGVYFYTGAIKGIPDIVFDNTANANPNIYKYQ